MSTPVHITAPIVRNVLVGRYAECAINGLVLVFLFEWEVNVESSLVNLTATGDRWQVYVPVDSTWTARGRGYISPNVSTSYISAAYNSRSASPPVIAAAPQLLTFNGFTDVVGGASAKIWEGSCYITSGRLSAPMGLFEQEITLRGVGVPSAGIPA
jgi:hypothetical protein